MADSYTAQGFTKPEPGASLNTWGSKLNAGIIDMSAAMLGTRNNTVTGDFSLQFVDADASASALPFQQKLSGSPTAAFTVTLPAANKFWLFWNATSYAATLKVSGGTGFSLGAGRYALAQYSSVAGDIVNVSPTQLPGDTTIEGALTVSGKVSGVTAGTATTDAVNLGQMSAAIALATTSSSPGTLRITSVDTTAKFLDGAIAVSGFVTKSVSNPGANEGLLLDVTPTTLGTNPNVASFTCQVGGLNTISTAAALTAYMPPSPSNKAIVELVDIEAGDADCTVDGNGKNITIEGTTASTFVWSASGGRLLLVYDGTEWFGSVPETPIGSTIYLANTFGAL